MKKLHFIFLTAMSLTFITLTLSGQVYGIEATDIELDTEYSDQLSTNKEIDFFKFNLPVDGNVVITFRHEGLSDDNDVYWNVYLYSETDTESPLGSMGVKATSRNTSFSTGIGAGTYLVKVASRNWWDDQYFLAVNFEQSDHYEKSPNHDPNQATMIKLNTEYSANLTPRGDVDFFKFNLPADGNVIVTFKHESISDANDVSWKVYLYSETDLGNPLGAMAIRAASRNTSFSTGIGMGTYLIKITPYYYHHGGILSWLGDQYFLAVNFEESDFYEKSPNRNPNQATTIELNAEYSANLAPEGKVDFFKFSLLADSDVVVTFRHDGFLDNEGIHWNVYLYSETDLANPLGSTGVRAVDKKASFSAEIEAGTYLIKITPYYYHHGGIHSWWDDQYFLKVQTDITQLVCPQVITYGKNPVSGNWISFPTPCDVPEGWVTQNTKPDGPCPACPVETAACPELETDEVAAILSPTLELHIPSIQYEGMSFWADFINIPSPDENLLFQLTSYGQN